jgi:hypothetical protein
MLTDYGIALLCQALYDTPDTSFDRIFNTDEVYCGLKTYDDCNAVVFRGSTTFLDWWRDFQGAMVHTDDIGGVEMGFYIGLVRTLSDIQPFLPKDKLVYVAGHSLGGGRANIFAALLIKSGYNVIVVTFGSPRPGDANLKSILSTHAGRSYKNGNDYVTDVPIPIHPLLPYEHPRDLISVKAQPSIGDAWGLLSWHHCSLYIQALKGLQNG